jgi:glutamyl-tRNA synthetase
LKTKDPGQLAVVFKDWLNEYMLENQSANLIIRDTKLATKLKLVQERATTLLEILAMLEFFYARPALVDLNIKQTAGFKAVLGNMLLNIETIMSDLPEAANAWDQNIWVAKMQEVSAKYGLKGGDSFMLLRLAVVGQPFSPPLYEAMQILGKAEVLARLALLNKH